MTDTPTQQPQQEMVRAADVRGFVSYNITAEGKAIFCFELDDGTKFAISMKTTALKPFRTMVNDVIRAAEAKQHHAGMASIYQPREMGVGNMEQLRNVVLLMLNQGAPDEINIGLPDKIALDIVAAIETNVLSRMTDADRRRHLQSKSKVLMPGRPRIILPGLGG